MKKFSSKIPLILASQSPRRKDILRFAGIPFRAVVPRGVVEKRRLGEAPSQMVERLALEKARWVSEKYPDPLVLGADTAVTIAGRVFGKPRDRREAAAMLTTLQGRSHEVWTGVALVAKGGQRAWSHAERTTVTFRRLDPREIRNYVKSREPYDKAGGYAIQGSARDWILDWRGDYFNVMGLPLRWVLKQLNKLGMRN